MQAMSDTAQIEKLGRLVRDATRIVAFTGAGISTETGIPDFRSPGGLWENNEPIYFQDFVADQAKRNEAWRRKFAMEPLFTKARPGVGHRSLVALQADGQLTHVITQNIDNLHQMSGLPEDTIIELHGNGSYATCLECRTRYELDWVRTRYERAQIAPDCEKCGGHVKAATVSFGQAMPEDEMMRAQDAAQDCDLFLVIGSSLVVFPAAGLPLLAREAGATLVILNRDPTDLDGYADLVMNCEIADALRQFLPVGH